ncbi:hypothetical protein ACS0TY_008992 [Phlomoides rotata]
MGNCQAVDAAALVVQHPSGKQERMYWPITASEVMKMNPGHYVTLIIPLPVSGDGQENSDDKKTVKYTRVKLLRPSDTLVLGRAYRLVTNQEVMKVIEAKKHATTKRNQSESGENVMINSEKEITSSESALEKNNQAKSTQRHKQRSRSTNTAPGRPKSWRPSLHSISEAGS